MNTVNGLPLKDCTSPLEVISLSTVLLPTSSYLKSLLTWLFRLILVYPTFLLLLLHLTSSNSYSAQVSLTWDPVIHSDLAGYKMFYREKSKSYNYLDPVWTGTEAACTVFDLDEHTNYCFVVRAFDTFGNESDDSKEVCWPPIPDSNNPPSKPHIISPYDGELECDLLLTVEADAFSDADDDTHGKSRWQIVRAADSFVVLDISSNAHLTELVVPHTVLDQDTSYTVRVKFYDTYYEASEWSDPIEFRTVLHMLDLDGDGIPDEQEVDDTVDLNDDGVPDNDQPEVIKSVQSAIGGHVAIGVSKNSAVIEEIEVLETIDPASILDKKNKPRKFTHGLFSYRLKVNQPGASATVRIYYSEDISGAKYFYMYDNVNGWIDYTQYATFNPDGRSVTVELKDGGHGDSDGVENGIIVDPGGISASMADIAGLDAGVGGGCFIATASFGSSVDPQVSHLNDSKDERETRWRVKEGASIVFPP